MAVKTFPVYRKSTCGGAPVEVGVRQVDTGWEVGLLREPESGLLGPTLGRIRDLGRGRCEIETGERFGDLEAAVHRIVNENRDKIPATT